MLFKGIVLQGKSLIAVVFYQDVLGILSRVIDKMSDSMTTILTACGPLQQKPIQIYIFFLLILILILIRHANLTF